MINNRQEHNSYGDLQKAEKRSPTPDVQTLLRYLAHDRVRQYFYAQ